MKKVLILTSTGGGGHISVSNALNNYLHNTYEIKQVFVFDHILKSSGPFFSFIFHRINGENIYNYFIRKKWYSLANLLYRLGEYYFTLRVRKIHNILATLFKREDPTLVISVIPIINQDVLHATKTLNIPFLLIPTDLDATTFLYRINKPDYPKFKVALAFDDEDMRSIVEKKGILAKQIAITGFPLRPDFFQDKNKSYIHRQFNIPDDKPIVLLLMGTQGSNDMYRFVKDLTHLSIPAHIVCCIGRNNRIGPIIQTIKLPEHISLSIIGFTQQISDLMEIADLILTKSGSVSVCETFYMNKPHLLDATSTVLRWEQFNHHFTTKHAFGGILSEKIPVSKQVEATLSNKELLTTFRNNLLAYDKKQPEPTIRNLITHILAQESAKQKDILLEKNYVQLSLANQIKQDT